MSKGVLLVQSAIEAQKSIIGSMLIDPELVGSVLSRLTDKDFIDDKAFIDAFCEMKLSDIKIKSWQEYDEN